MRWVPFLFVIAGCAAPMQGVAAVTVSGPRAPGGGLSLDLLPDRWIGSFRSDGHVLPPRLEQPGGDTTSIHSWEAAVGPKVLETEGLRLDAFAGARAWAMRVSDSPSALPSRDEERETWVDPIAGIRAEVALGRGVSLRFRGDSSLGNSGSDRAWRGSAAGILGLSGSVSLSLGWEMSSVHRERGRGGGRFLYDATLSGPFLALELGF
jgi:hypothetical protein